MTALSPTAPAQVSANLICMASMLVWAAGLPAADLIIPHLPPVTLTFLRIALAAAVLLPLWVALEGVGPLIRTNWPRAIWVGGVCMGVGAILLVLAQARTDAVTVAVVTATMPVIGIALECLLDGRRLTGRLVAGLTLSLIGGAFAFWGRPFGLSLGLGALAAFGSVLAFTWGSRATVTAFPDLTPLGRTTATVTGAGICALVAVAVQGIIGAPPANWVAIGLSEMGALVMYGIGSLAVSQVLWIVAVGRLGIGIASLHMNAVPFYVMLIVFAVGGAWVWAQAIGAAVVVVGVLIAQGVIGGRR